MHEFTVGFVPFGEVNTPHEVINRRAAQALLELRALGYPVAATLPVWLILAPRDRIAARNSSSRVLASLTVVPSMSCERRDAEDCEIEHPCPSHPIAAIAPSVTSIASVTSSPQVGLI